MVKTMPLTAVERDELKERETRIRRGLTNFMEVGENLLAIRDKKLYREKYKTFEAYAMKEFGMGRAHGYRMIEAFKVSKNCLQIGDKNMKEGHAREMAAFTPETQRAIWTIATDEKSRPTAEDLSEVIDRLATKVFDSLPPEDKIAITQREKKKIVSLEKKLSRDERLKRGQKLLQRAAKELKGADVPRVMALIQEALASIGEELD